MAKDKDIGSWTLTYEINRKDKSKGKLMNAKMKTNPNKIVIEATASIPDMTDEQFATAALIARNKVDAVDGQLALQAASHIASLRLIGAYCSELADSLAVGDALLGDDEDDGDD